MIVLGIESTCDETACAIVRSGRDVLAHRLASQVDLHQLYGGVVPELACRRHIDVLVPLIRGALEDAALSLNEVDLIAVAHGPGLIGALLIGLNGAKALSLALSKPLIGVNHIEAHLYAALMSAPKPPPFPALGVVASGGHSSLVKMHDVGSYELIGQTIDDAVGEAFDKVARILGLPYPGGPAIESLAKQGDAQRFAVKPGQVKGRPYDFSFSGLKTRVLYLAKGNGASKYAPLLLDEQGKADLAAAFQDAALGDIVDKALAAAQEHGCHSLVLGGGVTNSRRLRKLLGDKAQEQNLPVFWPGPGLSVDNAVMIAGLGYHTYQRKGQADGLDLQAQTRISF